ncbi:MAG: fumarylacetoacetate hydrolase family protein [Burkholderiales bacterium]|nr:fumarylacetoacetate hydrolase family protein [Burkholderiales bacterium]
MKFGRFQQQDRTFYGLVEGDNVIELEGSPFTSYKPTSNAYLVSSLKILTPCEPRNFYCAGLNYAAHIEWAAKRKGLPVKLPEKADVGYRSPNALCATDEPIVIPADATDMVQFEGELVAVVGKTAKHLTEENALSCILGYTLGNDVSERNWQKADRTLWRAKNCDSWKPMGPFIVTGLDPMNLDVEIRIDGKRVAGYNTSKMLFSAQRYIAEITKYMTLHPGDVIWLGTDDATEPNLADGQVCEIVQQEIGVLRNPVIREKA